MLSRNAYTARRFMHAQTSSCSPSVSAISTNSSSEHSLSDVSQASSTFRHLLRALLREATYLPDPAARKYYRFHIVERFRSYGAFFIKTDPKTTRRHDSSRVEKQKRLFALGKKQLRALARANLGHVEPLMKVLKNTYGRCGRRRARLLLPWLPADLATGTAAGALHVSDTQGVQDLLRRVNGRATSIAAAVAGKPGQPYDAKQPSTRIGDVAELGTRTQKREKDAPIVPSNGTEATCGRPPKATIPKLPEPLRALLRAQITSGLDPSWSSLKLVPVIPKSNIWRRPTPMCRQRTIIRRWKADIRQKLLPPLPAQEHKRLSILAAGSRAADGWDPSQLLQPQRRASGLSSEFTEDANVLSGSSDEGDRRGSLLGDTAGSKLMQTDETHRITPRFMSRCLQRILAMTPTLQNSGGEWKAHFGPSEKEWSRLWRIKNPQGSQKGRDKGSRSQNNQSERQSDRNSTTLRGGPAFTGEKSWMFDLDGEEVVPASTMTVQHWDRVERQLHREAVKIQKVEDQLAAVTEHDE